MRLSVVLSTISSFRMCVMYCEMNKDVWMVGWSPSRRLCVGWCQLMDKFVVTVVRRFLNLPAVNGFETAIMSVLWHMPNEVVSQFGNE